VEREITGCGDKWDDCRAQLRRLGLVNRVVPAASLTEEGRAFAQSLATGPTRAHAATKRMLHAWRSGGVVAADAVTRAEGPIIMRSQDVQEGLVSLQKDGPGHAIFNNR